MTKKKQIYKKITTMIMGCFLLLAIGGHQVAAAGEGSTRSRAGVAFVRDKEDKVPTDSSSSSSSDGSSDSSQAGAGGQGNSGNQNGGGKTYFPSTGEVAGGGLLALIGAGLIFFAMKKARKKQETEDELTQ